MEGVVATCVVGSGWVEVMPMLHRFEDLYPHSHAEVLLAALLPSIDVEAIR